MPAAPFRPHRIGPWVLFALMLAMFAVLMIWPILLTVHDGFVDPADGSYTFDYILGVFTDPVLVDGLGNALLIAVLTTTLCLVIAVPLAVLATSYEFKGKGIFSALVLVPLILPPFVGAIGLRAILGRFGGLNAFLADVGVASANDPVNWLGDARLWGVVIMEALHLYPIIYLNATAALANLDPALEQAAENLGASRWQRFRKITLPLIIPGLFAGGTIVFIWSFTELGTPLMFDFYEVTPVQVFWKIQEVQSSPEPYALVAVMLVASIGLYALGKLAFGGRAYAMQTRASTSANTVKLTGGKSWLAMLPFLVVTALAVMPHLGVVFASFAEPGTWYRTALPGELTTEHYTGALGHPLASGSIGNSLAFASAAMFFDIVVGVLLAWLIVRGRIKGGWLLDSLAMLPLAVPGLVLAFGYVAMSVMITGWYPEGEAPSVFQILGENPNPVMFLIIAYGIRRLPYVVRSAVAGLQQTSGDLEEAATNLGASPWYAMRRIIVPLIMANLIAGGLLAFSFAMLEVSDSLILAQTEEHYPITKAIYTLFERLGDGPYIASAMGVWGMALLTVTLVGASVMLGKKMGAIFRI